MSHKDIIYDSDPHFKINAITRKISNESSTKTALIQNDHNSERFSFEMDRFIEGHDMMECNRVEVHYNNNGNEDVYEVDDVQISQNDENTIVFSWLLSNNATQSDGRLDFSVRFACVADGGIVDYAWNTAIFNGISISKGMNNSEAVSKEISDIIAKWKEELKLGGGGVASYNDLTDKPITILSIYPTEEILNSLGMGMFYWKSNYFTDSVLIISSNNEEWLATDDNVQYKQQRWTQLIISESGIRKRQKINNRGYGDNRPETIIDWQYVPLDESLATKEYVDNSIGDIETSLENIIAKYGLGGDSV